MTQPSALDRLRSKPRRSWKYRIGRLALIGGLTFLMVVTVLYFQQESMIFPGAAATQGRKLTAGANEEVVRLTTPDGQRVAMLYGPALDAEGRPLADAASRPTLLFFYGNGQCADSCRDLFAWFRAMGLNVAVPDYLGYGASEGSPSEKNCYATADAAYNWLVDTRKVAPGTIIVMGWSLGGGVAVDLAARQPVGGLALFSTLTSVGDMASRIYPFLPVRWFLKHHFDSRGKIAQVTCPVLIGHGSADEMIPASMAGELATALGREADVFYVRGAGHNDFMMLGQREIAERLKPLIAAAAATPANP